MKTKFYFYPQSKFLCLGLLLFFVLIPGRSANAQCTYYQDLDGDGFGNLAMNYVDIICDPPNAGYVSDNTDCDDTQWLYADQDGDGFGAGLPVPCGVANNFDCDRDDLLYADQDGDGFGAGDPVACGVDNNLDCDDTQLLYADLDGDGFGAGLPAACGVANRLDCDRFVFLYADSDGDGFGTGAPVACGVDNNLDCDDTQLLYADLDGDGFGAGLPTACGVANRLDCDRFVFLYADNDGDGFGAGAPVACGVDNNLDCDDIHAAVNPEATELLCDGIDNDCNGVIDAGASRLTVDAGPNKIVYPVYPDSSSARLQSTISGGVAPLNRQWSSATNPSLGSGAFIVVSPTVTTVYYLTVTDANGCRTTDSVKVCVIDVGCGSSFTSILLCHGTGSASNPFVTICVDRAGARYHLKKHPGEQLGRCGIAKGCDWDIKVARMAGSGMEEIPGESEFLAAFPNPFEKTLTIRFLVPENDFVNVRILDFTGREIEKLYEGATVAGNIVELTFDGSKYSNGVYFLMMNTQNGIKHSKKLVLNK